VSKLEAQFTDGRVELFYGKRRLTGGCGCYTSFNKSGEWFESFKLPWKIEKEKPDGSVIMRAEHLDGSAIEEWRLTPRGEREIDLEVSLELRKPMPVLEVQVNIVGKSDYNFYTNSSEEKEFQKPSIKGFNVAWAGRPDKGYVGLKCADEAFPSINFFIDPKTIFHSAHIFNVDLGPDNKGHMIGFKTLFSDIDYLLSPGQTTIFRGKIILNGVSKEWMTGLPPGDFEVKQKIEEIFRRWNIGWSLIDHWSSYASDSSRGYGSLLRIESLLGDLREKQILDLGCGWGNVAKALSERGAIVTGIEHVYEHVAMTRYRGKNVKVVQGDGRVLPFRSGAFDIVVANDVIEHVGNWSGQTRCIKEVSRVLKPGGEAFFSTGNFLWPYNGERFLWFLHWLPHPLCDWYVQKFDRGEKYDDAWIPLWYSPWGLRSKFMRAGLDLKLFRSIPGTIGGRHIPRPAKDALRRFCDRFPALSPAWYIVVRKK